jgi:FMN phosphatase YigB (HAD superfamily)
MISKKRRQDAWKKKERQRRIIVDIDNTLWHLAPELWEALKKVNPEMPLRRNGTPASIERFMPREEFFRVLKVVHMRQEIYPPFSDAEYFLHALKERGSTSSLPATGPPILMSPRSTG